MPIFKGGDAFDPNNFRGISISSCLGKIFNRALNKRLQNEIEHNTQLKDTQAAYRRDYSTTDQIFIVNSLLNKYVRCKKKKLYACFVDFRKAFDNVWHTGLLYKLLQQYNVGGKFYGIIKSMYSNAKTCVKLHNGITDKFDLKKGIKQGDTLSPYLFNLYLNDINDIFVGQNSKPPSLMNSIIGCLLYADDLLILSETKDGLQHSLDKLYKYCHMWKLQINIQKTKVVIFTTNKKKEVANFKFGDDSLTISDTYSYLGLKLTKKGSFQEAVNLLKEKGSKAMYSMKSTLYTGITFQPDLPLKIFDNTIRPILVYGCEVWCTEYLKLLSKPLEIDKTPFENINNKFCKSIMGLPRQASNFGIKAELGRNTIFSFICGQAFRYWQKLLHSDNNRILKNAYFSEVAINANGGNSWATFMMQLLNRVNNPNLWINQSLLMDKHSSTLIKRNIVHSIANQYYDSQIDQINEHSKLRTYKRMKVNKNMEKYVKIEDIPLAWRKLFCAFRISCHDLEIERGRYIRPKKPPDDRICKLCQCQAETELHFMLLCSQYQNERSDLFEKVNAIDDTFSQLQDEPKFEYLMTSQNTDIIKHVMKYIYSCLRVRKEVLGKK